MDSDKSVLYMWVSDTDSKSVKVKKRINFFEDICLIFSTRVVRVSYKC